MTALSDLKELLTKLEDVQLELRSVTAAKELSEMTEEERRMLLMTPREKEFFIAYKTGHSDDPWGYFKEYQKILQKEYKAKQRPVA